VPETKGVTLEEMEEIFGNVGGVGSDDLARLEAINKRLGINFATDSKMDAEAKASHDEKTSVSEEAQT
jgi:hypothetical protein